MRSKLITLMLIAVVCVSCSKKNDTPTVTGNTTLMIGKWKDGGETDFYYTNGRLVYTQVIPAPNTSAAIYQFNSDGTFTFSQLQDNGSYAVKNTFTSWVLTDGNTFIHYVDGNTTYDKPISFSNNNNTAVITNTTTNVTYTDANNVTQVADSETVLSTIVRQ